MIVSDEVDGRALQRIRHYYAQPVIYEFAYSWRTNILRINWKDNAHGVAIFQLDKWFTPAAQDYIIDLIYPRI